MAGGVVVLSVFTALAVWLFARKPVERSSTERAAFGAGGVVVGVIVAVLVGAGAVLTVVITILLGILDFLGSLGGKSGKSASEGWDPDAIGLLLAWAALLGIAFLALGIRSLVRRSRSHAAPAQARRVRLVTSTGPVEAPDDAAIVDALTRIYETGTGEVRLESGGLAFLQASAVGAGLELVRRDGPLEGHVRCRGSAVTLGRVVSAFQSFADGETAWQASLEWEPAPANAAGGGIE